MTLSQRSTEQCKALVEASKDEAAATLPLVRKRKEVRHLNNARIGGHERETKESQENITSTRRKESGSSHKNRSQKWFTDSIQGTWVATYQVSYWRSWEYVQSSWPSKAWKIVNTITSRKAAASGKLWENPWRKEKAVVWAFQELVGNPLWRHNAEWRSPCSA